MCGRFSLNTTLEELSGHLAPWLTRIDDPWLEQYAPRAQIRPGEPVLVLYREHGQERLGHMLWGLRPGWVKDPSEGPRPFNARAESLSEKASFRGPWRHHRCLLPASAFLEKGKKWSDVTVVRSGWQGSGIAGWAQTAANWTAAASSPHDRISC